MFFRKTFHIIVDALTDFWVETIIQTHWKKNQREVTLQIHNYPILDNWNWAALFIVNMYIENTMFMYFDIKFIKHDQKMCWNGEACPSHSAFSGQAW